MYRNSQGYLLTHNTKWLAVKEFALSYHNKYGYAVNSMVSE